MRFAAFLAALAVLASPSLTLAAQDKPLVIIAGRTQTIPATDTLILPAATTANASLNLPAGNAPTSPNNGDCWTTTTGLFCRINGVTVGPYGAAIATPVTVPNGGTGDTSLAAHGVLVGAGTSAVAVTAAGTAGEVLTSNGASADPTFQAVTATGCANPCLIGTADVSQVSGVPSSTLPAGSLSMRTDVPTAYLSLQPTTSAPTRVQEKAAINTLTVTLSASPTPGNYMIAGCFDLAALPSANTGWTSFGSISASTNAPYGRWVYRLVQSGDAAAETPCTGGSNNTSVTLNEVSGMDPTWANSFQSIATGQANQAVLAGSGFSVTVNGTTGSSNNLALVSSGQAGSTTTGSNALTFSAGYTNLSTGGNTVTANNPASGSATEAFVSPSSTANVTTTIAAVSINARGLTSALIILQPPASTSTGPVPLIAQKSGTTASAGQLPLFSADAVETPVTMSQDCTISATGVITCLKTNNVAFTALATASATNGVTLGNIAQIAANTILGNNTGSTANISAMSVPSCSGSNDALYWTSGSGLGCHAPSGAGGGTVTSVATGTGLTGGTITGSGTLALSGATAPQGRLTLVTGTPVMTSDQTAKQQVYYDCYVGKLVPYYDGSTDQVEAISSCEVSTTMQTSSTGVTNSGGVFDVWWVHGGASRICVATNGSGGGWASDTSGSNTARGTGYSQVHNTRGYVTNVNAITHCYNGATDYGSVSADQATYLGTLYTTAAGKTDMSFTPAGASAGAAPVLGLWNGYNRVRTASLNRDNKASWTKSGTTWGALDASNSNRVSWVDGLGQSQVSGFLTITAQNTGSANPFVGLTLDSTSTAPNVTAGHGATTFSQISVQDHWAPQIGFHFISAMEVTDAVGSATLYGGLTTPTRQLNAQLVELEM